MMGLSKAIKFNINEASIYNSNVSLDAEGQRIWECSMIVGLKWINAVCAALKSLEKKGGYK